MDGKRKQCRSPEFRFETLINPFTLLPNNDPFYSLDEARAVPHPNICLCKSIKAFSFSVIVCSLVLPNWRYLQQGESDPQESPLLSQSSVKAGETESV